MTDEEVEKYFEDKCGTYFEATKAEIKEDVCNAFKDGYNKANEWHKPCEKLPEDCSLVLAYGFDDTEPSLYEFVASDCWEWMPRRIASLSNDQIRLWKEIVLPKESKE